MSQICHFDNVNYAYLRAVKGKAFKSEVKFFRANLSQELSKIALELSSGKYKFSPYREFTIYDPKRRRICAAVFRDRVVFHAMMRICHDVFDNYQVYDSYASRIGKGVYAAIDRAKLYCRKCKWFVKLDVKKYFDSIDQEILLSQLSRLFKDKQLLLYFRQLLDTYETLPGKGLPIGNLTSQYFANHYLSIGDHYCKENLRVKCFIRYMDDIVFFSNDKKQLLKWCDEYRIFVRDVLHLELHDIILNKTCHGLPFLGYVVYPFKVRLSENSRRRFFRKLSARKNDVQSGYISEMKYMSRVVPLYVFIEKADVVGIKNHVMKYRIFPSDRL